MEFGTGVVNSHHMACFYELLGPEFPVFRDKNVLLLQDTENALFT